MAAPQPEPRRMAFRILGLDHVVLRARDLERMVAFYRDVVGCTVERRQDAIGLVQMRAGRSLIDLVDAKGTLGAARGDPPGPTGGNMDHLCLRIDPFDRAALEAHLCAHGVAPGEYGRRYGAEGEGPSLYFDDAEGNTVELKGPPAPA
jgi:glyoxylase I family protein